MELSNGIFTVSLDFELYWGVRDQRTIHEYEENLNGVENAIKRMLELFDKHEIHATWATVGFLFAKDVEELKTFAPQQKPGYVNKALSPYNYIDQSDELETRYHFASQLVEKIGQHNNQEIGTHTFSHYYCLEKGQTENQFSSDIAAAIDIAKSKGVSIESLVFPRNQCSTEYLSVLSAHEIKAYRGNEKSWLYKAVDNAEEKLIRRALRLLDAYLNLSGANSYSVKSINPVMPYNIPSSRFLRPISNRYSMFEGLRKRRIVNAIEHAAKNKEIFHLWWHPHNFGANTDNNIKYLDRVLSSFSDIRKTHGMKSLNMKEIAQLIPDSNNHG